MGKDREIFTIIIGSFFALGMLLLFSSQTQAEEPPIEGIFRVPLDSLKGTWQPLRRFGRWYQSASKKNCGYHLGNDLGCDPGLTVYPIADGIVRFAGVVAGYTVIVEHKLSDTEYICSVYYHMKRPEEGGIRLEVGRLASQDNPIGYISGEEKDHSSVPHLHFGIRQGGYKSSTTEEPIPKDRRTGYWYYPGYTSIRGECDKEDPVHRQILAEWFNPWDFLSQYLEQSQRFNLGDNVQSSADVHMRTGPILGDNIKTILYKGSTGKVLGNGDNGKFADGYYWWYVQFGNHNGWCAENWLENIQPSVRFFSYTSASVECHAKYPDWPISPVALELKEIMEDLKEGTPIQETNYWSSEDILENQEELFETYRRIEAGKLVSVAKSGEATIIVGVQPEWDIPNIIRQWMRVDRKYGAERIRALIGASRILTDETHDGKPIEAVFDKDSLDFKGLFPELNSLKIHVLAKAHDLGSEGHFGIQIAVIEDKWTDYKDIAKNIIDSMKMRVADEGATETDSILAAMAQEELYLLSAIRTCQESYRAENDVYLECKSSPPGGGTDAKADPWADAGGFSAIGFWPDRPVLYQYAVTVSDDGNSFTATALGDLNENGTRVTYTITNDKPKPIKIPMNEY
jgi:murein DD-endopeptidase MepM/ murein hydrolase activator NlpD